MFLMVMVDPEAVARIIRFKGQTLPSFKIELKLLWFRRQPIP